MHEGLSVLWVADVIDACAHVDAEGTGCMAGGRCGSDLAGKDGDVVGDE